MISRRRRKPQRQQRSSCSAAIRVRIDTTGGDGYVTITSASGVPIAERHFPLGPGVPGAMLRALDALLRSRGGRARINGIDVVPGPGTFSRVRLGVVTANALAWALDVPLTVHGRRVRIAKPVYGKPPHIGERQGGTTGGKGASCFLPSVLSPISRCG